MKKYNIIYADPPWNYLVRTGIPNGIQTKYPTLSIPQICNLPIRTVADYHSVLFLWTTDAMIPDALRVISAWGFQYRTVAFVWSKRTVQNVPHHMWGNWTLKNTEQCLLATRGQPHSLFKRNSTVRQLIEAPKQEHSRKPDQVSERIVELLGDIPRLELFARRKTPGWDVWGNEVTNDIEI